MGDDLCAAQAIREMQQSQSPKTAATFDETNLIVSGGLVPVMRPARRAGLGARVTAKVTLPGATQPRRFAA